MKSHKQRPKSIFSRNPDQFKVFLTPREPLSIIQEKETRFSDFTTMNNRVFNKHMQIINSHEKKRLNLSERPLSLQVSSKFLENLDSISDTAFITSQRGYHNSNNNNNNDEDDETLIELKEGGVQKTFLTKFSFKYFSLRIKNKDSPLKVGKEKGFY